MDVAILGVGQVGRRYAGACAEAGWGVSLCDEDANAVVDAVEAGTAEDGPLRETLGEDFLRMRAGKVTPEQFAALARVAAEHGRGDPS